MANRITDYNDLLFPVRAVPVRAEVKDGSARPIPETAAIVNGNDGKVLSVVGTRC